VRSCSMPAGVLKRTAVPFATHEMHTRELFASIAPYAPRFHDEAYGADEPDSDVSFSAIERQSFQNSCRPSSMIARLSHAVLASCRVSVQGRLLVRLEN